jgi:hypothetical protein
MLTARPIPPDLRGRYLELVAQALAGRDVGDGECFRACRAAAKVVMWNVRKPDDPPVIEPHSDADSKLILAPTRRGKLKERADEQRQLIGRQKVMDRVRNEAGKRLRALREGIVE